MKLDRKIVRSFTKAINRDDNKKSSGYNVEGTIVGDNLVQLVGSSELTVVEMSVDAKTGDRVLVHIEDRVATVIGNYTNPPGVPTADAYIKPIENGIGIYKRKEDSGTMAEVLTDGFHVYSNPQHDTTETHVKSEGFTIIKNENNIKYEFNQIISETDNKKHVSLESENIGIKTLNKSDPKSEAKILCASNVRDFHPSSPPGGQIRMTASHNGQNEAEIVMTGGSQGTIYQGSAIEFKAENFQINRGNKTYRLVDRGVLTSSFSFVPIAVSCQLAANSYSQVEISLRDYLFVPTEGDRRRIPLATYSIKMPQYPDVIMHQYYITKSDQPVDDMDYILHLYFLNTGAAKNDFTCSVVLTMLYIDEINGSGGGAYPRIDF